MRNKEDKYKLITVEDIISFIGKHKDLFPNGLKTPIYSGDFECNYTHGKHLIQHMTKDDTIKENAICLSYEMHETIYSFQVTYNPQANKRPSEVRV